MASQSNKPAPAWLILLVILLGAAGMVGTMAYLTSDVKMSANRTLHWAIVDSSATMVNGQYPLVDTFKVTVHPSSMALNKKPVGTPDKVMDYRLFYLTYNPTFLVWIALVSVTVGAALALQPILWGAIYQLCLRFQFTLWQKLAIALIIITLGGLMYKTSSSKNVLMLADLMVRGDVLLHHPYRVKNLIGICLFSGLLGMAGQLLINQAISKLGWLGANKKSIDWAALAADFTFLKSSLKFFLTVDAALIVLSILTTDTLRRAIGAEILIDGVKKDGMLPKEFTYLYGLTFTLFLALLYLPIAFRMRSTAEHISATLAGTPEETIWASKFAIDQSPLESLKVALSILAPVVTALLPGVLEKGPL